MFQMAACTLQARRPAGGAPCTLQPGGGAPSTAPRPGGAAPCTEVRRRSAALEGLTGRAGAVTLAYSERRAGAQREGTRVAPKVERVEREEREEGEELDLTGDPLQAGFDPDQEWDLSGVGEGAPPGAPSAPRYLGVAAAAARAWLGGVAGEGEHWALVEGGEHLYLGSWVAGGRWTLSRVTCQGAAPHRALAAQLPDVHARHAAAGGGGQGLRTAGRALYTLCEGGGEGGGRVTVVAEWSRVAALLEAPPLDCSATLQVELEAEGEAGRELALLRGFVRGLAGEGVTWLVGEGGGAAAGAAALLEVVRTAGPRSSAAKLEVTEVGEAAEAAGARLDLDFTDRLWSVLCRAASYAELTTTLATILDTIAREQLRPFLYARNKTRVARLVHGLARGEQVPALAGALPLQLAAECGAEKLRRDFTHRLVGGELAAGEAVRRLLGGEGELGLAAAVARLGRLAGGARVAGLVQAFLPLPADALRGLVQAALATLEERDTTSFTFPLPPGAAGQLARTHPASWQVPYYTNICTKNLLTGLFSIYLNKAICD